MDDAIFKADRMQEAIDRLTERIRELKAQEEQARRSEMFKRVKAERDQLADQLKALYPPFAEQIGPLLMRIKANDREIEFVNGHAADG